jgi:GDP-mannose transporter
MGDKRNEMLSETAWSVIYYSACSSVLLVANKVAIHHVPLPGTVFAVQLAVCTAFVLMLRQAGVLEVDAFTKERVKKFLPYIFAFVVSIYANGKALEHSNVETVITFRASTPICVSVLDWALLGRELPSRRSLAALLGVVIGTAGYMSTDKQLLSGGLSAYFWDVVYLAGIVFEMTYGKWLLSGIKFDTPVWGSVLYTNALGLPPLILLALASGETALVPEVAGSLTLATVAILALTCLTGIGISWAGWNCRSRLSATSYTLLGVACKMASVALNVVVWDQHAGPTGIFWLAVCLCSSSLYQQAPMRQTTTSQGTSRAAGFTSKSTTLTEASTAASSPQGASVGSSTVAEDVELQGCLSKTKSFEEQV